VLLIFINLDVFFVKRTYKNAHEIPMAINAPLLCLVKKTRQEKSPVKNKYLYCKFLLFKVIASEAIIKNKQAESVKRVST
jgi:hypothetical protein